MNICFLAYVLCRNKNRFSVRDHLTLNGHGNNFGVDIYILDFYFLPACFAQ